MSEAGELILLPAERLRLFRALGAMRLTLEGDRSWTRVGVARAFPISEPDGYVGFLDGANKDIGMVEEPARMDAESRRVLEEELALRYFVPRVERVISVKEEFGSVYWQVITDRGERQIVARSLRDNVQELSATRLYVTDVEGNRFEFPDIRRLDQKSQAILVRSS